MKNQTSLGEEHSIKYLTSSPQKQGESEKPSARRSLRRPDEQIQHAVGDGVLEQIQATREKENKGNLSEVWTLHSESDVGSLIVTNILYEYKMLIIRESGCVAYGNSPVSS